ncbi:MAG TPA: response regulator [Kofleriaceae bacterium]|nr:response regulator [Kofleriaceae bacterium]
MTHDVLVIDDSATVRKLVEISLRGRPLRPHFADSGGEGIRRATALAPAAILLDFMLPDMTGVEVCRALAADARTQSIPILVVTAKHERTRSEFQPFPSVVDFIGKPFAAPDLVARIDRAIAAAGSPAAREAWRTGEVPREPAWRTTEIPREAAGRTTEIRGEPAEARRDPAERAAKLLFARLRDGLALLPSQLRALDPGPIAPQLARRLLTPQVVEAILADLRPLYAELAAAEAADARRPRSHASAAAEPPAPGAVVDRAPGFSSRVQAAALSSLERRVLAVVDGRSSTAEIAQRLAIEPATAAASVRGLIGSGLVHEVQPPARPRPVVICDPDVVAFEQPLRALLARRATARELIAVGVDEVVGVTRQRQACLVMVNATARVREACAVAQALRGDRALADLAMVAVVDPRASRAPDLLAAGFDAVLAKPVMVHELERFLIPADLR